MTDLRADLAHDGHAFVRGLIHADALADLRGALTELPDADHSHRNVMTRIPVVRSMKDGVPHVRPPAGILDDLLALRLHLDDCDEENGALWVIPGSHLDGHLDPDPVQRWKHTGEPVLCQAAAGDVLLMRPLLLHSSRAGSRPGRRRVLHVEYADRSLPGDLDW